MMKLLGIRRRREARRLRVAVFVILSASVLALPAGAAQGDAKERGAEAKIERPASGMHAATLGRADFEVMIVRYWSRGSLFRSEAVISGHPLITIVNGDSYHAYDELSGEGYTIRRSQEAILADAGRHRPFAIDLERLLEDGGEKIRDEVLAGVEVEVYRVTDDRGRRTLWVSADPRQLPIRLETYDRSSGRTGKLDWVNWLPEIPISESFFTPPAEVKFRLFESYDEYLKELRAGPIIPAPPLFHYLLRP